MTVKPCLAQRMFDGRFAAAELEDALDDAGVVFERIGYDYYDNSVELYDAPPTQRLSAEAQKIIYGAGFAIAFVNHTDKWETHYNFDQSKPFAESDGWRVSYPHKRGEDERGILVEDRVPSWPPDWFETGYAKIVSKDSN